MAAQNEVQFYSATLDYDIWEFISNVNFNFHKIINSYPVNLPHMNAGYESVFWQNRRENGNKKWFALRKREWFTKCFELEWWHITDIYSHQWVRYAMLVSDDWLKKRIFKQCYATVRYWCYTDTSDTCCSWQWKEITSTPFSNYPCVYDKFVPIKWPVWKNKHSSCRWVIANVLEWNTVRSVLYELDTNWNKIPITVDIWDWIYIYDNNWSTAVVWQSLQTSWYSVINQWLEFWEKFWSWITNKITDFNEEWWITEYKQQFVCFKIFKEYGNAFAFATSDGIQQWNNDSCDSLSDTEFTIFGETKFDSVWGTVFNPAYIKSMANVDGWLSYLTANGFLVNHYAAWITNSSFHWTSYSTISTIEWWDVMLPVQDYVMLFGPNSVGIAYKTWLDSSGVYTWEFQKVLNDTWYFSRDAVLNFREQVYFVDQDAKFWRVNIKPYDTWLRSVRFQLDLDDMSMHWVNTDFRMMNRKQWDHISLHKTWSEILVFMTDNRHNSAPRNTKILIFDEELKFWHRWMICWIDIRHYANWCWYWDEMFCNQWDTDNGSPIKQIISMNFWDTSMFTMKEMAFLKTALWYHSRITNDTILKISVDTGWYKATKKIKHLHRTKYLWWLNKLRKSWMTDESMIERFFHWLPTGIGVYSGNGVWLVEDVKHELTKEFEQYCWYENVVTEVVPCPCKTNPEISEHADWCTINPDRTQNFEDDTDQQYFTPSKYAVIKSNLWYQCHNMHIEFIANNKDEIEFIWFFIGWMFMDNSMEYLENCTDYPTTPEISKLPWKYLPK
jgi:hypothetical protein